MSDTIRCPGCGQENPADAASCGHCNFPLQQAPAAGVPPAIEPEIVIRRPVRRPRRPSANPNAMFLWMSLGLVVAALLVWQALDGFRKNNAVPVAGASADQQREADSLRTVITRDSTNVEATIEYANVLYDTANWAEAARYYARGIARDSTRVTAIVDMGVCWYNQGETARAAELFELALAHDPAQPVALFNLGIVNERTGQDEAALKFFHRALESGGVSDEMKQQLVQHMQKLLQKTGRKAPPLDPSMLPPGSAPPPPAGGPGR